MSPIGRLFFEISGDTSRLNASRNEAIKTAGEGFTTKARSGSNWLS